MVEPPEKMRPGDWTCPSCNSHVFASKRECYLCQTSKPTDDETVLVRGEAAPLSKPVEQMKMAELRAFAKEHCGDGVVLLAVGTEQRRTKADVAREVRAVLVTRNDADPA